MTEPLHLQIARIVSRYSFKAPMPISLSVESHRAPGFYATEVHAFLATKDHTGKDLTVHLIEIIDHAWIEGRTPLALENYVRCIVEQLICRLWMHEFDEWLRYRGELVKDPHAGESTLH